MDPDPAIFVSDLEDVNYFFSLLLFERTFTSFLMDKKSYEVTKQQDSRFFSQFLLDDRRIRIRMRISVIQEARKHGSYGCGSGSATLVTGYYFNISC
jgi:hypothetical protein